MPHLPTWKRVLSALTASRYSRRRSTRRGFTSRRIASVEGVACWNDALP